MTTLFFRNPRMLILALALVIVSGLSAYRLLPRTEDPQLIARGGQVLTHFPGATAERVEALVTDPIEERLAEIEEIRYIDSTSRNAVSVLTIELHEHVDNVLEVWSRVRDKLDDTQPLLPPGITPQFDEIDITAYSVISAVVWRSEQPVQYGIVRRLAEMLEDRLRDVPGTADVELFGDPQEEVRLEIDSAQLASLGLTPTEVAAIVHASDAKVAAGALLGERSNLLIEVEGELDSMQRIRDLPIRRGVDGRVLRLADVARVSKTVAEPPSELAVIDDQAAIAVAARMEEGRRIDHWAAVVRGQLDAFAAELPQGITLETLFDQSRYVEERLGHLLNSLIMGIVLVIAVSMFTMGWRGAVVIAATLPLASLMTLAGMRLMGLSIHQMSITGLIIALGLLIDNAIVIVDSVRGRIREGRTPTASIDGSLRKLFVPLLGSTLTTVLAFMPIVLAPGGAGEFIGPLGLSVVLALTSSFILSMTVVPAVTALIERWWPSTGDGLLTHGFSNQRMLAAYSASLDYLLARPVLGLLIAMFLPIIGFVSFIKLPVQFFPAADRDQFQIQLRLPEQTAIQHTRAVIQRASALVEAHPRVQRCSWFVGSSAPKFYYNMIEMDSNVAYYAQALVQMDTIDGIDVINRLQTDLDRAIPEAQVLCRQLEQGPPFPAPIELWIYGPDLDTLRELGFEARTLLSQSDDVTHTLSSLGDGNPQLWFDLDEEQARLVDVDHVSIARQLEAHLYGAIGGSYMDDTEELPVRLRVVDEARGDLDQVSSIDILSRASGRRTEVPLSSLGHMELVPQRSTIPRRNGQRVNIVHGYLKAGVLPSEVLAEFKRAMVTSTFALPDGYRLSYGGEADKRQDAINNLMASVGLLATLMAATLVLSFRSFRLAGLIAIVGILAVGLAVLGLRMASYPFGFIAIVGTMGLVGVAINDAIVVLAAIRDDAAARQGDVPALRNVVLAATRHVVSTTVTTIAGFTPLLIGGGQFWPPLAVVIAGGVGGATLLALYFVPSAYRLLMVDHVVPVMAGGDSIATATVVPAHASR